jgi:hypothetical protein
MLDRGYIKRAWELYIEEPLPFIIAAIILVLIGFFTFGILTGPILCGYIYMTFKKLKGERVVFDDAFWGFRNLEKTFFPGLLYAIIVAIGYHALVLPGIILGAMLIYTFPFIVDKGLTISEAFRASWNLTKKDVLDHSLFYLLVTIIGISGIILFGVGVFFTAPLGVIPFAVAYHSLTYPSEKSG